MTVVAIVGHRGAAELEPENTLRGFDRAIERGADSGTSDRPDVALDVARQYD